jgi:hypothetical protein
VNDQRLEDFARRRASGASQVAAAAGAGYRITGSSASKLARRADVAARIAELKGQTQAVKGAELAETIIALLALAKTCEGLKSATALKEARLARLEAHRLYGAMALKALQADRRPRIVTLNEEEWTKKYGPQAPKSL